MLVNGEGPGGDREEERVESSVRRDSRSAHKPRNSPRAPRGRGPNFRARRFRRVSSCGGVVPLLRVRLFRFGQIPRESRHPQFKFRPSIGQQTAARMNISIDLSGQLECVRPLSPHAFPGHLSPWRYPPMAASERHHAKMRKVVRRKFMVRRDGKCGPVEDDASSVPHRSMSRRKLRSRKGVEKQSDVLAFHQIPASCMTAELHHGDSATLSRSPPLQLTAVDL